MLRQPNWHEQPGDHGHREHRAQPAAGEIDALRDAALAHGNPREHRARHAGKRARLARPEEKTHGEQRHVAAHHSAQPGKHAPQHHHRGQQHAGAETVGDRAGGCLKERITERERRHHPAPLRVAQRQVASDVALGRRDASAVHIEQHGQQKRPEQQEMAFGDHDGRHRSSIANARTGEPSPPSGLRGSAAKKTFSCVMASRLVSPSTINTPPPRSVW